MEFLFFHGHPILIDLFQILVFVLIMESPLLQTKNISTFQKHLLPLLWG